MCIYIYRYTYTLHYILYTIHYTLYAIIYYNIIHTCKTAYLSIHTYVCVCVCVCV